MAKIAILYCKRIKDISCVACAKCFKAVDKRDGAFAKMEDIQIIAMTHCGDCPGLVVPRVKQLMETAKALDTSIDTVYFGTCMKLAMETAACPIDFEATKAVLAQKFGVEVLLGTHSY
jgi:predicted metal-binding protein